MSLNPGLATSFIEISSWNEPSHDNPGVMSLNPGPARSFIEISGERGGSVVECRTPEREVRGSRPTAAVLCPWARHFTPRKYWLITQEAMAPSRYDWKIVDWDVKPQHNQPNHRDFVLKWAISWLNQQNDCAPSKDPDQPGHPLFAWRNLGSLATHRLYSEDSD